MLGPDRAVVADFWNQSVKIVSTNLANPGVIVHLKLEGRPFDVTIVPGDKMAVTIPEKHKIVFSSTKSVIDNISQIKAEKLQEHRFEDDCKCYGIHYDSGYVFVAVQDTAPKVLMMAFEGTEVREFSHSLMQDPRYLTVIGGTVYVSNSECVLKFNIRQKIKAEENSELKDGQTKDMVREFNLDEETTDESNHTTDLTESTEPSKPKESLEVSQTQERNVKGLVAVQNHVLLCNDARSAVHMMPTFYFLGRSFLRKTIVAVDKPVAASFCPDRSVLYVTRGRGCGNQANCLFAFPLN